ncbi:FUSC family protein [Streptacidiphilus sp. ASG 303]|uniref:FUSC family protein n=1 Tax=Streptacidiphilus sp. ASG 303 TaxID=2896847 RepID=UPI001E47B1BE|nr:FUSC family protein [Streptacidiphilus sp. ASG 303]MCD0481487.1 FUSC family protein [Streptacidiphilus sp. ASG 303]
MAADPRRPAPRTPAPRTVDLRTAAPRRPAPDWLRHPLQIASGPGARGALLRGALSTGPLLAAGVAAHRVPEGVLAALGAMFATVNDRAGTRRTRLVRIGVPGLAVAVAFLLGSLVAAAAAPGGGVPAVLGTTSLVAVAAYLSGAVSTVGPVASMAALQALATLLIAAGLPHHGPPWTGAAMLAGGAGWVLLLAAALAPPHRGPGRARARAAEEREAVAAAFDALGGVLRAAGTDRVEDARRTLTAALDRAHAALDLHRRGRPSPAERRLRAQLAVAADACEAAVTLLWEARPLPAYAADAPLRLARAVRTGAPCGPLAAPAPDTPGRRALHEALLHAAEVFGTPGRTADAPPRPPLRDHPAVRRALGPLGREYGLRVALCTGACTAVAQFLRPDQWYWLPVTAVFLVKPDLGPLFSRSVNRLLGTAAGVGLFAAAAAALPGAAGPVAATALCGALLPVAWRNFAFQTAALTPIVLAFAVLSGSQGAPVSRLVDTVLGCGIALAVGHLPRLGGRRTAVAVHWAAALRAAQAYLERVVDAPDGPREERLRLRRAAYRALAEARTAVSQAAAELPPAGVAAADWAPAVTAVERLVDATTACAVRVEHGGRPLPAAEARSLADALARLADDADARRRPDGPALPDPVLLGSRCASLADVAGQLHAVRALSPAA